jgi:hypothetical protein
MVQNHRVKEYVAWLFALKFVSLNWILSEYCWKVFRSEQFIIIRRILTVHKGSEHPHNKLNTCVSIAQYQHKIGPKQLQ